MPITPSYLRDNLYGILDQAVETGSSPEIMRNGVKLRIVAEEKPDVFSRLEKHPKVINGTPDSIINTHCSQHWHQIFLDTHFLVWLYAGSPDPFSERAKRELQNGDLVLSPMVLLELQYLHEAEKINEKGDISRF